MRALVPRGARRSSRPALQYEGDLVLRALRSALNALARGDDELADEVIGFDDEIDRRYLAIETGVQSLLARQTPVAIDLRLVLAILRVNLHLERMADYCVTVAKLTKLMGGLDVTDDRILDSLEDMGQRAEQMIRVALDAFADRDADKARSLNDLDDLIDRANRQRRRRRALARRLARGARVRAAHARHLPLRRAHRRPRRRHRRAGRLPRHRRAARADRRLAPGPSPGRLGLAAVSVSETQDAGAAHPPRERAHLPRLVADRSCRASPSASASAGSSPASRTCDRVALPGGRRRLRRCSGSPSWWSAHLRIRAVERAVDRGEFARLDAAGRDSRSSRPGSCSGPRQTRRHGACRLPTSGRLILAAPTDRLCSCSGNGAVARSDRRATETSGLASRARYGFCVPAPRCRLDLEREVRRLAIPATRQ